jgi:anti-sigma regulatory factor (Ser/Thr protein kinase)
VLSIPGDDGLLGVVHELTQRVSEHAGFDPVTAGQIASAVSQTVHRGIQGGGAGRPTVEVSFRLSPSELRIEVWDSGRPRPAADKAPSPGMDSVSYRREAKRNVACLVKRKEGKTAG